MIYVRWIDLINLEFKKNSDDWLDVELCTLPDDELTEEFPNNWGQGSGKRFYIWTKKYVYYVSEYDGIESCKSVPRNPEVIQRKNNE